MRVRVKFEGRVTFDVGSGCKHAKPARTWAIGEPLIIARVPALLHPTFAPALLLLCIGPRLPMEKELPQLQEAGSDAGR
jgi:hypothetical protein